MKKIIIIILLFAFINLNVHAVDFDTSIDENIRKDYNLKEAEETLPALPNVQPSINTDIPLKTNVKATGKVYTLKSGSKIILSSQRTLTDYTPPGSKISFVSQNNIYTKDGTIIPAGTLFKGTITDSHPPQITGNGGLIELKIDEIYHNGIMSPINTKISLVNSKRIFLSDIKGKRSYWKNVGKSLTPGKKVFKATEKCAHSMAPIPVINIFSVVPYLAGIIIYTINFTAAPVISIFRKGGNISLPSGTKFEIKINGDAEIRG